MIPFFSIPFFVGPAAQALGGADIAFVPGLLIGGGLYYLLARKVERSAEAKARHLSERALEGALD
ncbi:hypothetical protein D3C80_1445270 [compost metagenome]